MTQTPSTNDPRIDFCIMSLQSAAIETDWDAFRQMVLSGPSADEVRSATVAMMTESGFGPDEIEMFSGEAVADIERLVDSLKS